jgi:hypothetical protein
MLLMIYRKENVASVLWPYQFVSGQFDCVHLWELNLSAEGKAYLHFKVYSE